MQDQLVQARKEFDMEKDDLQSVAAEHKSAYEKIENELHVLQEDYETLIKELDEKQEEMESKQRQHQRLDVKETEIQNLKVEIKDLQDEIEHANIEKADLEDQIKTLQRDAATLIEKDGKVARERSEERKMLQAVMAYVIWLIAGNRRASDSNSRDS